MACNMHKTMIAFFILWSLYKGSLSAKYKVVSAPSVVATLGSDVLLTSLLAPEMSGEKMEIRWFKPMYRPYVHLYINGKDDYTAQMPQFANRTELLKENITRGIFPLMIRNLTAQDSGKYYCYVESSDHHSMATVDFIVTVPCHPKTHSHKESGVRIPRDVSINQERQSQAQRSDSPKEGAVGSPPVISTIADDTVFCESDGWYPEPYLIWTDNEGNKVMPSMEKVFKDEKSLYQVISAIYLPPTSSNITCTVSSSLNQSKESSRQIRAVGSPPVISTITEDTVFCESDGWYPEPYLVWTDDEGNNIIPSMEKVSKDKKSLYQVISAIYLPPASSNITCTVSSSLNQSKQSSRQTIEMRPVTCRDQYSRYIVFCACLVVILMLLGYICFLLKRLGELQRNVNGNL
ncbi:selection and upkeep of intraepithelial T-cells protein 1 isoform X1 [Xenopus tropicalis]|uniref:Selection and upkeep of intraepithelial T-cells protein 1 isoform X1 n=1 Tax=Xenopus tropicalis TaxID=8364 RepID=A0A8J1INB3_XENTR|nr:selection and upkeep of intraepithelial T-cells protein 1 isoform X1 [Xenopus tropicalis]XP_031747064.1 selection and upkeep of intraepithelial T-cells protein 1 isoform X1 [Xenopus tropicalis]|eukprot:XP_017945093.1 PREDICTED: selection and upkeep of intraepithelial T-cells protein 1-like isoform X1 [Xenopus tropicalis]